MVVEALSRRTTEGTDIYVVTGGFGSSMRSGNSGTCENKGGEYLPDLEVGEGEIDLWACGQQREGQC